MGLKTKNFIEVKGKMIYGVVDGTKFFNSNETIQRRDDIDEKSFGWTLKRLQTLKEDIDELVNLMEGVEVAEDLTRENS